MDALNQTQTPIDTDHSQTTIELTVPARQDMMLVVRLATAGVLARSGLSLDAVEDMKHAVEEVCICLIRASGCRALRLTYWLTGQWFGLRAQVDNCPCQGETPSDCQCIGDEEIAVIRCVLLSMVSEVDMSFENDCLTAIDLRQRLSA